MQVISWQTGYPVAIDNPACADPVLARLVRHVNDTMCTNRDDKMLCPECSLAVLHLAHRTVGTRMVGWPPREACLVHAQLAVEQAEKVEPLLGIPRVREAISAARMLLRDPDSASLRQSALAMTEEVLVAAEKARSHSARFAAFAIKAAVHATTSVNSDSVKPVVSAAGTAITRAFCAAGTQVWCGRPDEAHRVIDRFSELAGLPELDPLAASDATPALA
jgi:hypothetical protein